MPPRQGDVICGHVQLGKLMPPGFGSSIFGEVFVARDLERDRDAWLTFVDGQFFPSPVELSQFMAGANALESLRHPAVAPAVIVDREEDYCVVGYETTPEARSLLEMEPRLRGEREEVGRIAAQVARGLAFLHRKNLLHGMLGPTTIIEWEGTYKIWQHGIAALCDSATVVQRARRDSRNVYPPEFLRGAPATTVTDVYAWAVTIARLAAPGDPVEAVHAAMDGLGDLDVPDGLERVIQQSLSSNPDKRPRDGVHLLSLIEEAGLSRSGAHRVVGAGDSAHELSFADLNVAAGSSATMTLDDGDLVEDGAIDEDEVTRVVRASDVRPPGVPASAARPGTPAPPVPPGRPAPVGRRPAPPAKKPSPRDPTGGIATLASAHGVKVGDDGAEPDLLELAGDTSEPIPLEPSGPISLRAEPREQEVEARFAPKDRPSERAAVAVDRSAASFLPPRLPGPHGPRPRPMAGAIAVVAGLLPVLAFVHVASDRGLDVGVELPKPPGAPLAPAAGGTDGEAKADDARDDEKAGDKKASADDAASDALLDGKAVPPPEPPPVVQCPPAMVQISKKACMDVAEFPGDRRVPRTGVTHREAAEACEARGARLCSAREFKAACGGPRNFPFPYGAVLEQGRCNTASVAGYPSEVGLAGAHEGCVTPAGVKDLVGNVGEWVAQGFAMGGDSTTDAKVAVCTAQGRPPPGYKGPDLGFRCCADLGPAPPG